MHIPLGFRPLALLATAGSASVLLGALGSQHFGGLSPCEMCIWQRWPHAIAIALGLVALAAPRAVGRIAAALAGLVVLVGAGIALFHTGVERKWWEGITECSVGQGANLSVDDLMAQIMNAPVVRCDEVQWDLFGLSMASWNGIASLGFVALWIAAALQARKG